MSFTEPLPQRRKWVGLLPFAAFLLSLAFFAYAPQAGGGYATIGAILLIPFCLGISLVYFTESYSLLGCLIAPIVLTAIAFLLVYSGVEGIVCVAMALPFWVAGGAGGGLTALWLRHAQAKQETERAEQAGDSRQDRLFAIALVTLPLAVIYVEQVAPPEWESFEVSRQIEISASADEVWPLLVTIPAIDKREGIATFTHDWLGIPRPSEARLIERDGKLVRLANWGDDARFEERITHKEQGKALGWRFAFPDSSIQRYTDRHIQPHGPILWIESGNYRIEPAGAHRVRVTLTTSYQSRSRLNWYWQIWGEQLLGDVQDNVLEIIKQRSEAG